MRNFNLGSLDSWQRVPVNQLVDVPGEGGPRSVRFVLLSAEPVEVYVTDEAGERRLVAVGEGLLRVAFTTLGSAELEVIGETGLEVLVHQRSEPQVVPASDLPSFTTIEPRGAGPSQEVRRMMLLMRVNQDRREAMLKSEIERLAARAPAAPPAPPAPPAAPPVADAPAADPA